MEEILEIVVSPKNPMNYIVAPRFIVKRIEEELTKLKITKGEEYYRKSENRKEIISILTRNIYENDRIGIQYNFTMKKFKKLVYLWLSKY